MEETSAGVKTRERGYGSRAEKENRFFAFMRDDEGSPWSSGVQRGTHANPVRAPNDKGKGLIQRACPHGRAGETALTGKGKTRNGKGKGKDAVQRAGKWVCTTGMAHPKKTAERLSLVKTRLKV